MRGWIAASSLTLGCASPGIATLEATSSGGDSSSGGAESSTGAGSSGTSSTGEPACVPDFTKMPERVGVREVEWVGVHAAGSEHGDLYLAGALDDDVRVMRIDETGAELWSARWGNVLGWDDVATGLHPTAQGVLVSGVSGLYPSQEYPWTGTAFVRAYARGGVVRWTWEDSTASFMNIFGRNDGPVVALNDEVIAVVAPILGAQDVRTGVRFMMLSLEDGTERARVEYEATSTAAQAAWLDETGALWVAARTSGGSSVFRWDGSSPPSVEAASDDVYLQNPRFYPDGTLLDLWSPTTSQGLVLQLVRYSRTLDVLAENRFAVEGLRRSDPYDASVTFGCGGVWLSFLRSDGPTLAIDDALEESWAAPGLGSVAVTKDRAVFVGYDAARESAAIWQMEWAD